MFQMCPQITCLRGCIVTLVAFVWLFSTVRFQMSLQIACLRGCKVTFFSSSENRHIGCICLAFLHCAFSNVSSNCLPKRSLVALVSFNWLFTIVSFQMCPQIACRRGCIITLVAFVWLFSTVSFQMSPQTACLRGCKFTLVTFI